jgi:amidase
MQNAIVGPSEKIMSAIPARLDYPYQYQDLGGWRIALDWGAKMAELIPSVRAAMQEGVEALRRAGCVVVEVDCGFSKDQVPVMMRGLMSSAMGTLPVMANSRRDLLSPYVAEQVDLFGGALGPTQAAEGDALTETLHRQVQQRVFKKGYRVLLMPTLSTPFIAADLFSSKADLATASGLKFAMTWPWNLLNRYPVMGVPLGVVEDRMPSGMQAIADTFDDLTVFQFANGWSKLRPPLYVDGQFPTFARG